MKRFVLVALVAIVAIGVSAAAPAAAKPQAKLAPTAVSDPPATAKNGDSFPVTVTISNNGDRDRKARARVYLREGDTNVTRLAKSPRKRIRAGAERDFPLTATVDPAVPVGHLRRDRLRQARRHLGRGSVPVRGGQARDRGRWHAPGPPPPPVFTPGARTLGDGLFPQIGNGGYDARHYEIELDYDPAANRFDSATTTMHRGRDPEPVAVQPRLPGRPADQRRAGRTAPTRASAGRAVRAARRSGERDPADEAGRRPGGGDPRRVRVHRRGRVRRRAGGDHRHRRLDRGLDPGLLPAVAAADLRRRLRRQRAARRAELVPVEQLPDRQGDLRHSDHGPDGEDGARRRRARRRDRQRRRHEDLALERGRPDRDLPRRPRPSATSSTRRSRWSRRPTGRTLPVYNAIDATATVPQQTAIEASLAEAPGQINFLSDLYGAYPFDSDRRGGGPRRRRRLRARGADEAALLGRLRLGQPVDQHRHPAARARAPVVRQQRHARALERHLVQGGLRQLVGLVLELPRERRRRPGR